MINLNSLSTGEYWLSLCDQYLEEHAQRGLNKGTPKMSRNNVYIYVRTVKDKVIVNRDYIPLGPLHSKAVKEYTILKYVTTLQRRLADNVAILRKAEQKLRSCRHDDIVNTLPECLRDGAENLQEEVMEALLGEAIYGGSGAGTISGINNGNRKERREYAKKGICIGEWKVVAIVPRSEVQNYTKKRMAFSVSEDGVKVRSKSELYIISRLHAKGIKYAYEQALILELPDGTQTVKFPDFIIFLPNGDLIIWEHFGSLGDGEYRRGQMDKMDKMMVCGLLPGKNFIITCDELDGTLDARVIDDAIAFILRKYEQQSA